MPENISKVARMAGLNTDTPSQATRRNRAERLVARAVSSTTAASPRVSKVSDRMDTDP